jgi:hypothetical protein
LFSDSARKAALPPSEFWHVFKSRAVALLKALYDRHSARPIADEACWLIDVGGDVELTDKILHSLPFCVSFQLRANRCGGGMQWALRLRGCRSFQGGGAV